jgi:hypothetical protein
MQSVEMVKGTCLLCGTPGVEQQAEQGETGSMKSVMLLSLFVETSTGCCHNRFPFNCHSIETTPLFAPIERDKKKWRRR